MGLDVKGLDENLRHRLMLILTDSATGFLGCYLEGDEAKLGYVAVDPDRQGQGYGGRLMDLAEAEARRLGYGALNLYTHERMTENIALYGARGYEETGRRRVRGYDRVYMRKTL